MVEHVQSMAPATSASAGEKLQGATVLVGDMFLLNIFPSILPIVTIVSTFFCSRDVSINSCCLGIILLIIFLL